MPVLALGCAHEAELQPVPAAGVAVRKDVAAQEVSGVRIEAAGDWRGEPSDLDQVLTPVRLTIENHSGRVLRIRFQDFALVGEAGFGYAALPPFRMQAAIGMREAPRFKLAAAVRTRAVVRPMPHPRFAYRRFYVAPYFGALYPGFESWPYGTWAYDPLYYDRWYGSWPVELPSQDMLEEALPEGAVADGGSASGFLYFQLPRSRERQVDFEMALVDARSGESFGTARIPFIIRQ